MDDKQASIVYQNQSHLAFEILKFNTKPKVHFSNKITKQVEIVDEDSVRYFELIEENELSETLIRHYEQATVDPKDVIKLALKLTRVALNAAMHLKDQDQVTK